MRKTRTTVIILGVAGLVAVAIAVYFLFFAGSGYVEGRPTLMYFRLPT